MARIKEPNTIFGQRMKAAREGRDLSQKVASIELKITPQVLMNYEKGIREPSFEMLNRIAEYYEVSVDYLTGHSDYKTPDHRIVSEGVKNKTIQTINILNVIQDLSPELRSFIYTTIQNHKFVEFLEELMKYKEYYPSFINDPIYRQRVSIQPNCLPDSKTYAKERFMIFIKDILKNLLDELEME